MTDFEFILTGRFKTSVLSGIIPSENFRIKSLLLLLGQGKIKKRNGEKKYKLSKNFITIPSTDSELLNKNKIISLFTSISDKRFEDFFKTNLDKNYPLHKKVFYELLSIISYYEIHDPIPTFIYIYRLIEQISLSIPTIAILKNKALDLNFADYKQLFDGDGKSDLSVLKKYSENVLSRSMRETHTTLDFSTLNNANNYVNIIKGYIPNFITTSDNSISFQFQYINGIIISFRNEYFHSMLHQRHLDFNRMESPEGFLNVCNAVFINYIGRIFFDLIETEINIWG